MAGKKREKSIRVVGWEGDEVRIEDIWREAIRLCYPREVVETTTTTSVGLDGNVQWSKTVEKRWTVEPNMKAVRMVLSNFDSHFHDSDEASEKRADQRLRMRKSEMLAKRWSVDAGGETTQPMGGKCAEDDPRGSDGTISED